MQKYNVYTDLACEAEISHDKGENGTSYREKNVCGLKVAHLTVENEIGEKFSGKKQGEYITLFTPLLSDIDSNQSETLLRVISGEIDNLMKRILGKKPSCVLVAGLGNREITADNIGPKTVDRLNVTRHLKEQSPELFENYWCSPLCAIAPGVLGQTGIESAEIISAVCNYAKPDVVIAIDALAARATERLGATVQISDNGIFPGSGIGNRRSEISRKTLGIPVIAIGIPTVVNSSTLVYDALCKAGYDSVDENIQRVLKSGESFFVSPKQSDLISESAAEILSGAINQLFLK